MAKKKIENIEEPIVENIVSESLEDVMGDRYAAYAKYVIQDRAIPDVRDGLKPVQRRIIFSMYKDGNTINKPTKKCAHTVGAVMGKYHPHGDTSIYDALARMSQSWKVRLPLVDFQGNNGSIDGDYPAAYRYTEARLSEAANELIRDIDKDTVEMQLTFDDSDFEPEVLPSRFPNLLVNGSEGIAVALATEIPPHNLKEVISAVIYRINHETCSVSDLMKYVKGPDFPTGGIIYNGDGLTSIYETGRGRIEVAAKTEITEEEGFPQIVVTEVPYKIIKKELVAEIDRIRVSKVIDGIVEVRDESDIHGLRFVVDLKKNANAELILQYLMKKTSLVTGYSANMVAIVGGRPKTLNLLDFVDAYVAHQDDVLTRRTKYDLNKNKSRLHIVDGLIIAILAIDEVVRIIRASKSKADSKLNLIARFSITDEQAEAIVMLPLYKLNNTDVNVLYAEKKELEKEIAELEGILSDHTLLNKLLIKELKQISTKYGDERRTQITEKVEIKQVSKRDLIAKEDVVVAITRDGYIKRSSVKSFKSSGDNALPGMKDDDILVAAGEANTKDFLICFTNLGNYFIVPVNEIGDCKWKDEGKHINCMINLSFQEKIIRAFIIESFREDLFFVIASKKGQIKRTPFKSFEVNKCTRPLTAMRLLSSDEIADVRVVSGNSDIVLFASNGNVTYFNENDISITGTKSAGVKSITSLKSDYVTGFLTFEGENKHKMLLLTDLGCLRIFDLSYLKKTSRLGKVQTAFRSFKSEIHTLVYIDYINQSKGETYLLRYMNNKKTLLSYELTEFYLTPIDKYAKKSINLPAKTLVSGVFQYSLSRYDNKTLSYYVPKPEDSLAEEKAPDTNDSGTSDKKDDDKNYEQISIFDDLE